MTVRYETDGPVAVVTIDRPEVRNAVDGPTAAHLAAAQRFAPVLEQVLTALGAAGADEDRVADALAALLAALTIARTAPPS